MAREIIPKETSNDQIKIDLLQGCIMYGDMAEAHFWANYFVIELRLLPDDLRSYIKER